MSSDRGGTRETETPEQKAFRNLFQISLLKLKTMSFKKKISKEKSEDMKECKSKKAKRGMKQ